MKDFEKGARSGDTDENSGANKFSQASTTAGSEMPYKSGGSLNRQIS